MVNSMGITKIYPNSLRANIYGLEPFRMIGLIDVGIIYSNSVERVTLPFFRSSGTNSGKIKGLWYPIAGIKIKDGKFTEFTSFINYALSHTTRHGKANKGWLAKSLFFNHVKENNSKIRGFSNGRYYEGLYWIGKTLRELYENDKYKKIKSLNSKTLNMEVTSKKIYNGNKFSQKENFENYIADIFMEV